MAVFTKIEAEQVQAALARYDVPPLTNMIGMIEGVENTTYLLACDPQLYILTMFERRVETVDLPFIHGFVAFLNDNGVSCSTPVKDKGGRDYFTIHNKPCVVQVYVNGVVRSNPSDRECYDAGQLLGKVHALSSNYHAQRDNPVGIQAWRPLLRSGINNSGGIWISRSQEITDILDRVENAWPRELGSGAIHGDYFKENVLFDIDGIPRIIDFYLACSDFYGYDLALACMSWGFAEDGTLLKSAITNFIAGYRVSNPIGDDVLAAFPVLLLGAALRILATRLVDRTRSLAPDVVVSKQPEEFWKKLKTVEALVANGDFIKSICSQCQQPVGGASRPRENRRI